MLSYVFPGNIDTYIAKIGAEPIPYMRTDEFSTINLEGTIYVMATKNR